jgi:hypothetical protein
MDATGRTLLSFAKMAKLRYYRVESLPNSVSGALKTRARFFEKDDEGGEAYQTICPRLYDSSVPLQSVKISKIKE